MIIFLYNYFVMCMKDEKYSKRIEKNASLYDLPIKDKYLKDSKKVIKKKRVLKKWVLIVIIIGLLIVGGTNVFVLIKWGNDNKDTSDIIDSIGDLAIEIEDNENTENINEVDDVSSDYWYYVSFPLINVNFDELLEKNSDTVAWLNVNNTNINYPVVQASDNDYYLNHSFDNSYNEAGWVFLDYRNSSDFSGRNNIIYAHSRLDKTMFGSLSRVLKSSWYTDKSNHIIRLSTPSENTLWQIFSVYVIEEESYYITTNFNDDDSYVEFLNTIRDRSRYDFDVELSDSDKIITLSTCYSDSERTVVHAKLIKRSKK